MRKNCVDDTDKLTPAHDVPLPALFEAIGAALVFIDLDGTIRWWNAGSEALFGWRADEVVGRSVYDVLVPIDERAAAVELHEQIHAGHGWEGDFTVLRRGGDPVRIHVRDRPVRNDAGEVVGIVGISIDVTEVRLATQQAGALTEHLRLALDAGGLGTWRWDLATGITRWDERLEALFGLEAGGFDGTFDMWVSLIHPDDRADALAAVDEAVATKGAYIVEHRVLWPDGSVHWVHGAGRVTLDDEGRVTGSIGCCADVTGRIETEQERERLTREALLAAERLEFLGQVNEALAGAHTRADVMRRVTEIAVPRLGDWCSIYVLPTAETVVPEVEIAHVDPAMVRYARELQQRFPYDPAGTSGVPGVIRSGRPELIATITDDLLDAPDVPDDARALVRELGLRSIMTVPLIKMTRIAGAIQFVMTSTRRSYTQDDLALAEAVAARIASKLDNLRLNAQQHEIAATLQASLLPAALPDVAGVDIAVRYWPAGEGVEVGGDFYDVFALDEPGRHAVVIGDVCGTGPTAAAVTGMARHTIASAAWHAPDPAGVLRHLNTAMRRRGIDGFLTAAYGVLTTEGPLARLELGVSGHPLPVVARADGSASLCGRAGTMLGAYDDITVNVEVVELEPGDTLVLYTDGATDVRPPYGLDDAGMVGLVRAAATGGSDAATVADAIERALGGVLPIEQRNDDIAVLVLRVH